mgnify:CR=1 FL=1
MATVPLAPSSASAASAVVGGAAAAAVAGVDSGTGSRRGSCVEQASSRARTPFSANSRGMSASPLIGSVGMVSAKEVAKGGPNGNNNNNNNTNTNTNTSADFRSPTASEEALDAQLRQMLVHVRGRHLLACAFVRAVGACRSPVSVLRLCGQVRHIILTAVRDNLDVNTVVESVLATLHELPGRDTRFPRCVD